MNKTWSDMNKEMQTLLSREATFKEGIVKLIELRDSLFEQLTQIVTTYPEEAFYHMPFAGAKGYHSKTLGYSLWHIFRIEDIVTHEMIAEDRQVLFAGGFDKSIGSPLITTGNELAGEAIADFSKKLNIRELYRYAGEVKRSSEEILKGLSYADLKKKFGEEMLEKLKKTAASVRMKMRPG